MMTPELRISQLWTHKPEFTVWQTRMQSVPKLSRFADAKILWSMSNMSVKEARDIKRYIHPKKTAGTKAKCALCGKGKSININLGCSLLFNHNPIWYSTVNNMSQLWQIFLQLLWGSATINRKHDQDLNPTDQAKIYIDMMWLQTTKKHHGWSKTSIPDHIDTKQKEPP